MCWRQVSKLQKNILVILCYITVYLLISYMVTPDAVVTFISDDLQVGNKYALMFLLSNNAPPLSDTDGANVFTSRHCDYCFLTNNKGFLPMSEYDAILFAGRTNYTETAVMDPQKRFFIETTSRCIHKKLVRCKSEPVITSFDNESYDLCGLCEELVKKRKLA